MAKRQTQTFSMSFLDVISCGFGAVVLFYTIISAQSGLQKIKKSEDLAADARLIEQQVLDGYKHLAELRNTLQRTDQDKVRAAGLSREVLLKIQQTEEELSRYQFDTLARREALERLKADLKSLEEQNRRLQAQADMTQTGSKLHAVAGDGDRQYLTGLRVGGKRILLLVDASASMLDETVVNVLRMRNMAPERRLRSEKWQQVIGTVDWVTAQLPLEAQVQIYAFNTKAWSLAEGGDRWLKADDSRQLGGALQKLRQTAPEDGTSLINAFAVIKRLSPAPDNVILITDGLPTQGEKPPAFKRLAEAEDREDHMRDAVRSLGQRPPSINIILLPMEGDPTAPTFFWRLAQATGGAFLSPPKDWP